MVHVQCYVCDKHIDSAKNCKYNTLIEQIDLYPIEGQSRHGNTSIVMNQ